jgi:hypothetical protein
MPHLKIKKSPVTPLGIDPETFRLAAQCLNHYVTPGPTHVITAGGNAEQFPSDIYGISTELNYIPLNVSNRSKQNCTLEFCSIDSMTL